MKERKNRNRDTKNQGNYFQVKNGEEEYHFLREVIKEKPVNKKRILWMAGGIFLGAVLFGIVAAFTFSRALPYFQPEEESSKVDIPDEVPEVTEDSDGKDPSDGEKDPSQVKDGEQETEKKEEKEEGAEEPKIKELGLEDFQNVYRKAVEAAKEPEKSLVTVQGITSNVDWMNNSYENKQQISGFLVADSGKEYFVVTEYRVVDKVDRILVTFSNGKSVDAHFQKQDPGTGLVVLKINKDEVDKETRDQIQVATLGSSSLIQRGDPVLALGSPAGYSGSISYGMITSVSNMKNTVDNEYHLLTTDIMGDSEGSGVLISMEGKIVGVIVQSFAMEKDRDVVTALPISELKDMIERLSNKEDLIYLGIRGQDIVSELSQKTGIPKGVYVNAVEEDSPAMQGGIQNGDVVVKVQENSVENLRQLRNELNKYKAEQKITVTAMRKGAEGYVEIVFDVTVGAL